MSINERVKMVDTQNKWSIVKQYRLLEIHRGCFYYKAKQQSLENLKIMQSLDQRYFNTPFYSCRKLTFWRKDFGFKVNRKRVKQLMQIINWQTIYREPKITMITKEHKKHPYLLKGLKITHKYQVWATDITYIPMAKGFMYLTAIIDLHTRFVLNWSVSNTMSADWCADILQETIQKYGVPEIFNTDQGSQYTSEVHTNVLLNNGMKIYRTLKDKVLTTFL